MVTTSTPPDPDQPPASGGRRWWQRPWMAPLAGLALIFLAFSVPPYTTLNPNLSRIAPPEGFPPYYPALVCHVMFATVAMLTCTMQVWPWFRRRFPIAHRHIGRIYVFGGALPAAVCALIITFPTPFGPVAAASAQMLAILWLICTIIGFRMARQRRFTDHRRWMIRSFALTFSIITNRLWGIALTIGSGLSPEQFADPASVQTIAGMTTWLGWTIPLLIAEWWLVERHRVRARQVTHRGQDDRGVRDTTAHERR